jgi:diguanylate cyclase (GGDEF)-like protein
MKAECKKDGTRLFLEKPAGASPLPSRIHPIFLSAFSIAAFLLIAVLPGNAAARAKPPKHLAAALPTLTTALQVHGLSSEEASRSYPVHLRAVVTFFDRSLEFGGFVPLFVRDETGCIFVKVPVNLLDSLPAGSLVEIEGVSNPGEFAPIVAHPQIKVIGHPGLPGNPLHPNHVRLMSGTLDGQWVEVEGVIHSMQLTDGHVNLQLEMDDGNIPILMAQEKLANYSGLVDARVRILGNAGPLMDRSRRQMIGGNIHCPGLSAVRIVEPAPADPFKLRAIPIDRLLQWDLAPLLAHRVHLRGRVTLQWPGSSVCIRDAAQGICAQTDQSARVRDGELIDIAGFARAEGSAPVLTDAVFRSAGPAAVVPVEPLPATGEQALLDPSFASQLVRIDGRLISHDLASQDTTLLLSNGIHIFKAILPRTLAGEETHAWQDGSVLRVTGICSVQLDARKSVLAVGTAVPTTFQVLMRSTADVSVLQRPPWWTPIHGLLLLAVALAGTMAVLAWVVSLRRRVQGQANLLRESEERFRYMAQHDALTGLANRPVLEDRLNVALQAAKRRQAGLTLMMLDLDKFKEINDGQGHHAGDEVLRATATRLAGLFRKSDTVARLGGDEFVALLPDMADRNAAGNLAAKVVAALSVPISFAGHELQISVSLGVCVATAHVLEASSLMKAVDAALYRAKARGRNCFEIQGHGSAAA